MNRLKVASKCLDRMLFLLKESFSEKGTPSRSLSLDSLDVSSSSSRSSSVSSINYCDPVQTAKRLNKEMWERYQSKLKSLESQGKTVNPEQSLVLARKMHENLMEAQRIMEKKNQNVNKNDYSILNILSKRIPPRVGKAKEFIVRLTNLLDFSSVPSFDSKKWESTLKESIESEQLILLPIVELLQNEEHPFHTQLNQFLLKLKEENSSQVSSDMKEIRFYNFMEDLHSYEIDLCNSLTEKWPFISKRLLGCKLGIQSCIFDSPIYSLVFNSLLQKHAEADNLFATKSKDLEWKNLFELFGIRKVFWLGVEKVSYTNKLYDAAVRALHNISASYSPLDKLLCFVNASNELFNAFYDYQRSIEEEILIGSDDLFVLFAFLLVRSRVPHLYTHFEFISEFIPEEYILGKEGYILATVHQAASFILDFEIEP